MPYKLAEIHLSQILKNLNSTIVPIYKHNFSFLEENL
ncbi:hypothetical protein J469_4041, partial [Acinetobacter baumannii 1046051]